MSYAAAVGVLVAAQNAQRVAAFRKGLAAAGFVEGRVISIQEITQLALLPSKEELISKIMFLLNAPAQRIATALNALPRNLAVTVNEAIKAKKFGSDEGAPAATPAGSPEAAQ